MKSSLLFYFTLLLYPALSISQETSFTIAFGSCNDEVKEQKLWDDILAEKPDLFIWLGDNIYADTRSYEKFTQKYDKQKAHEGYAELAASCEIVGVWDDHDYGKNDAGKEFKAKELSQRAFCNFFDLPDDDVRRHRPGIYTSKDYKWNNKLIKLILLDTRYFRDELIKKGGACQANHQGTILGEEQWKWLENEINSSKADLHIIASSIQFLPTEHRFEKWSNFPSDRQKMIDLLKLNDINKVIFLSGDRHTGEISFLKDEELEIYDITSSSMTHGISPREEANKYRLGNIVFTENYGILNITDGEILVNLKADHQETKARVIITY